MSEQRPKFFLDLDRTLFRTDKMGEVARAMAELFPALGDGTAFWQESKQFYEYPFGDATYFHNMVAQIESHGVSSEEVFAAMRQTEWGDGRMQYKGTAELINDLEGRGEVRILTFGEECYQSFKASLCPSLAQVAINATLQQKGEYLSKIQLPLASWMVDDKPIGDQLPQPMRFIQILHGEAVAGETGGKDWPVASTLDEVQQLIALQLQSRQM